jgi:hypothetical protein
MILSGGKYIGQITPYFTTPFSFPPLPNSEGSVSLGAEILRCAQEDSPVLLTIGAAIVSIAAPI